MGALIDSLLSLARVTRTEMNPEWLDLTVLARETVQALAAKSPCREYELRVPERLHGYLDHSLARTLFANLLENAWKFSAARQHTVIECGAEDQSGVPVYFVRDNGIGFDMAHADKLFIPFQRLHSEGEVAGTGIGLATAQRIVHRHGGRIWATGIVDGGASVYFTLAGRPAAGLR
jgi:signal transduction histidine kinase